MGLEFVTRNRAVWSIRHRRLSDGLASLLRRRSCAGEILFSSSLVTRSASKPAKRRNKFTPCDDSLGSAVHPNRARALRRDWGYLRTQPDSMAHLVVQDGSRARFLWPHLHPSR